MASPPSGVATESLFATGAGGLFAQPTVADQFGNECRFDELLGRGFAVVGRDSAALECSDESRAILDLLDARCVATAGLELRRGVFDWLLDDHSAAIVRPDRYVFGVVNATWSLDRLIHELARKLGLVSRV